MANDDLDEDVGDAVEDDLDASTGEEPSDDDQGIPIPVVDSNKESTSETADLQQRMKDVGDNLRNATLRFGRMTAMLAKRTGEEVGKAVDKTSTSIQGAVTGAKDRQQQRKEARIEATKEAISEDGIFADLPAMVDLPTPEEREAELKEHVAMYEAQTETQLSILEELERLSTRLDVMERRIREVGEAPAMDTRPVKTTSRTRQPRAEGQVVSEALMVLGASLLWVVSILGIDHLLMQQGAESLGRVPLSPVIWAVGTSTWVLYLLARLARVGPWLDAPNTLRVQTSLAVGITTLMALVFTDDTTQAMSDIWVWGTVGMVALILTAGLVANAWRTTKRLVGIDG
jgi:hypothetical protein